MWRRSAAWIQSGSSTWRHSPRRWRNGNVCWRISRHRPKCCTNESKTDGLEQAGRSSHALCRADVGAKRTDGERAERTERGRADETTGDRAEHVTLARLPRHRGGIRRTLHGRDQPRDPIRGERGADERANRGGAKAHEHPEARGRDRRRRLGTREVERSRRAAESDLRDAARDRSSQRGCPEQRGLLRRCGGGARRRDGGARLLVRGRGRRRRLWRRGGRRRVVGRRLGGLFGHGGRHRRRIRRLRGAQQHEKEGAGTHVQRICMRRASPAEMRDVEDAA